MTIVRDRAGNGVVPSVGVESLAGWSVRTKAVTTDTFSKKTGDTARTVQAMLADTATTNDRGLDRTGVVDCRAALQALIDEHPGEDIILKAGTYKLDNSDMQHLLKFTSAHNGTRLRGERGATIKLTTWNAAIVLFGTSGVEISGFDIVATASYPYNGADFASFTYRGPFETYVGAAVAAADRNYVFAIGIFGSNDCYIHDLRCYHQTPGAQNFVEGWINLANNADGTSCHGNRLEDLWLDDYVFGILVAGQDHGYIRNIYSMKRYHQPGEATQQANGHLGYSSSAAVSHHFDIENIHDEAILQSAVSIFVATVTMNYRGLAHSKLTNVFSTRAAGFLSIDTLSYCTMSTLRYVPSSYTSGGTIVFNIPDNGLGGVNIQDVDIHDLQIKGDFGNVAALNSTQSSAAAIDGLRIHSGDLAITVTSITTIAIMSLRAINSRIRLGLRMIGTYAAEKSQFTWLDGSQNCIARIIPSPDAVYSRVAVASTNNVGCYVLYEGIKPMPYGSNQFLTDVASVGGLTLSMPLMQLGARVNIQSSSTSLSKALIGPLPKGRYLISISVDSNSPAQRASGQWIVDFSATTPGRRLLGTVDIVGATITALDISVATTGIITVTGAAGSAISWFTSAFVMQIGDGN